MSHNDEPVWPTVDPDIANDATRRDERTRGRGSRRLLIFMLVLAVVLVGVSAVAAQRTAQVLRMVDGTAVALPATAASTRTSTRPTTTTTTTAPIRPVYLLDDHPLLAAGVRLPATTCQLPRFRRDTESLRAYYQAFVLCMDAAWQPVLAGSGLPGGTPQINVSENPRETGCGDPEDGEEFTALYCPVDETLYLPVDRLKSVDQGRASSHLAIVAHEYGHHVQELSGLLRAAGKAQSEAGEGTPRANELSRRTELQANCFAGLLLSSLVGRGAISHTLANQAVADFRDGGLPDTHGSKANQAAWARAGYQQGTTAACNTWTAPARAVS